MLDFSGNVLALESQGRCSRGQRGRLLLALALAVVGCWLTASVPSQARDLWVDKSSPDCSDDLSAAEVAATGDPWCTLGAAGQKATAGDVVTVRRAVYNELQTCLTCRDSAVLEVLGSGTLSAPIRFLGDPGVVIDGSRTAATDGIRVDGSSGTREFIQIANFEVRDFRRQRRRSANCVFVRSASDVTLTNLDVHHCDNSAVELHSTKRVTLEDSRVHDNALDNWTSAVDLLHCGPNNVIRRNFIWNNSDEDRRETEGHGIIMDLCMRGPEETAGSALIENNVIWNNEGWCFTAFKSDNATVRHNTCWHNGVGRPDTGELVFLGDGMQVYNNLLEPLPGRSALHFRRRDDFPVDYASSRADYNLIVADPTSVAAVMWLGEFSGTVADYQAYRMLDESGQPMDGPGNNVLSVDPQSVETLVAPELGNFSPRAGSLAIDTASQGSEPSYLANAELPFVDVRNQPRPVLGSDRGAYERPAASDDAPPIADLVVSPPSGPVPLTVVLDGSGSSDDVGVTLYRFDFGDGVRADSLDPVVEYSYRSAGTYNASLEVFDDQGASATASATVVVTRRYR